MSKFNTVCHKRSSVATDGIPKQPTTDQIDYGEIAVNYADGSERLFIKNSSNEIIGFKSGEYVDNALSNHNDRITTLENYTEPDKRANVLWVGTSIPAGTPENNYPQMVADALGFNLYNNSIGASFITFYPNNGYVNDESYNWQKKSDIKEHVGYCLSATKQDVENKFRPILERIKANDSSMTDADIERYIGVWK